MFDRTYCNPQRSMVHIRATLDRREKLQALSLAKDCYSMKLDLLTNATVVNDAIKFVAEHNNHEKPKSDRNQEQQQDNEMIAKTNNATSNQVF